MLYSDEISDELMSLIMISNVETDVAKRRLDNYFNRVIKNVFSDEDLSKMFHSKNTEQESNWLTRGQTGMRSSDKLLILEIIQNKEFDHE